MVSTHDDFIVTHKTKRIMGVTWTEVHDVVYLDGKLAEDTLDWYAQDRQGNVWYFGENTAEFEDGRPVTLAGTFTAGINNDKPGYNHGGEFTGRRLLSPGICSGYRRRQRAGSQSQRHGQRADEERSTHCLKTEETTPLEPDAREDKYYAPGVGNVLTVDLQAGDRIKLVKIHPNNE